MLNSSDEILFPNLKSLLLNFSDRDVKDCNSLDYGVLNDTSRRLLSLFDDVKMHTFGHMNSYLSIEVTDNTQRNSMDFHFSEGDEIYAYCTMISGRRSSTHQRYSVSQLRGELPYGRYT